MYYRMNRCISLDTSQVLDRIIESVLYGSDDAESRRLPGN